MSPSHFLCITLLLFVLIISDTCGFLSVDNIAVSTISSTKSRSFFFNGISPVSQSTPLCTASRISSYRRTLQRWSSSSAVVVPLLAVANQQQQTNTDQNDDKENHHAAATTTCTEIKEMSESAATIDEIISKIHKSNFLFRIVVVGNGAILETTSRLGPIQKSSVSPQTGQRLVTLASQDQSFEFHIKIDQVHQVRFVEKIKEERVLDDDGNDDGQNSMSNKIMRICRLLNPNGDSICSLILADSGPEAVEWFAHMKECHDGICKQT